MATDGGIAMMNEQGEYDFGRIENLFGVQTLLYQNFALTTNLVIGGDDHYVTLDYDEGDSIGVSGGASAWPLLMSMSLMALTIRVEVAVLERQCRSLRWTLAGYIWWNAS